MSFPFDDTPLEQSLPPLRIHHIMLWTVVSAVMLTAFKILADSDQTAQLMQGGSIPYVLVYALAICGSGLGVFWKRRGLPFFHQPGHTAFISFSLYAAWHLFYSLIGRVYFSEWSSFPDSSLLFSLVVSWGWVLIALCQAGLSLYFAYRFREIRRWRLLFILDAVMTVLPSLANFLIDSISPFLYAPGNDLRLWYAMHMLAHLIPQTIFIVFLAIVANRDRREKIPLHWTHWLGVATPFVIWLATTGQWIWTFVFPPEWLTNPV